MFKTTLSLVLLCFFSGFTLSAQVFERQILSSSDDAEEKFDGSDVLIDSSDLELMYDSFNDQGIQKVGIRFQNIAIPADATINSAHIQFTADRDNDGEMTMTFQGENVSNSAPFVNVPNNISNRATTVANVLWDNIPDWIDTDSGEAQRTPDLSSIVTEVITSNDWMSGNPITFVITGTGNEDDLRKAESFDGNASLAPVLTIAYASNSEVDLELSASILPAATTFATTEAIVQAEISSFGNILATDYTVSYSLNGTVIATEAGITPIALGETTIFTFAQTADLSVVGTYDLEIEVIIDNDENTANNAISKEVNVVNEVEDIFFTDESAWSFYDDEANPGNDWFEVAYDDTTWNIAAGNFGFGDGDEVTALTEGLISYYFRKKINVEDVEALDEVFLHMLHDDGAVVYINGEEVLRSELMPLGSITHTTPARQAVNTTIENDFFTYKIDADVFVNGKNTIAITVRNAGANSSDVSFDAFITPTFTYDKDGPYIFYEGDDIIVQEVTAAGLVTTTYDTLDGVELTCDLPHIGTSFTFTVKSELPIEPSVDTETPSKFLAISDFDGHVAGFIQVLIGEGVIDEDFNWTYGDGHLMISGDLFDRGFHIQESMWLIYKLENEAIAQGGKIHLMIGNHEMFNMTDDWRFVLTKYFNDAHLMGKRMSELYDENTELGRWLRSKNIIEKVGDYAFMHGGIRPEVADLGLTYTEINDYGRLMMNGIPCPNNDCDEVTGDEGIFWYRGMVREELTQEEVDDILESFSVEAVILGHTKDSNIRYLYNGGVVAIDMFHVDNFNNGFMRALQFEAGCFFQFQTSASGETYTALDPDCDQTLGTAIELNGDNQLKLFPNPTSEFLHIEMPDSTNVNYDYTIFNLNGQLVSKGRIAQRTSSIDISAYAAGSYVLLIKNNETVIKGSFILK